MAEASIVPAIQVAASSALPIIQERIKLAWSFKDDLKELHDSLDLTGAFSRDAQTKQVDEPLKVWLKQLQDVDCKADELIDELAYEDVRRKVETRKRTKVKYFFCPSKNPILFTLKMAKKVTDIKLSMKNINQRASELGLQQRVATAAPVYSEVPVNQAFVTSTDLIGRADDVQKIAGLLTAGSTTQQTLSIVSIVGMAGLGKTALAKSVSKTEEVKSYYSNKIIEVCVSENFDVSRILKEMFESLISPCGLQNEGAIIKKIQEEVKGEPYLLMLDDVWDEDPSNWNALRTRLLEINEGNRSRCMILVTTRNKNVAIVKETPHENTHHLENLKDDECWSIIKGRAFKNSSISSKFKDIGREIARKCGGVPLIATIIGGTMFNNPNIEEWELIRDDPLWSATNKWAVRVLKLSFDRLSSPSLKQCFAYCSIFPKDFNIQKEQLIQLWMAEGFLQQSEGSSQQAFEDIGRKYFDSLLSNSLLQDEERDKYGCITTCKMHDLVHDLAQSISKAEIVDSKANFGSGGLVEVKLWHSLFVTAGRFQSSSSFKGLRVLKFIGASLVSLPHSISNLKLLRYFDISGTDIGEVTESISKLYLLQTLRFLDCASLEKLPYGMKNLVSLRHLCFNNRALALNGIDGLTNLQTLPMFNVRGENGCGIGELGNLSELGGDLTIFNLQNVRNKEEAGEAKLLQKKNLRKLKFEWDRNRIEDSSNEGEVLEGLKPHSNLKSLTIKWYDGVRIPLWLESKSSCFQLIKLEKLKFSFCRSLVNLPALGHLPNLKFLKIDGLDNVRSIGKEFYFDDNGCDGGDELFPALETFSLENMKELEEWLIEEEPTIAAFPSLKELTIIKCNKLSRVPMMSRFSSLEKLEIERCNELCWTRELEEGDGVFPSTLKFLSINNCDKLRYIPGTKGGISSLQKLTVYGCEELSRIGETLLASTCLRVVWIDCPNLECIPLNGGSPSLLFLDLSYCRKLVEIKGGLSKSTRLETLSIQGCPNLTSLPIPSLDGFSFLSTLQVYGCQGLTSLPSGLQTCTSLQRLSIRHCSNVNLESFPAGESLSYLICLNELELGPFSEELEEFPLLTSIHNLRSSLKELKLFGWEKLSSLPLQLQHLTALKTLQIRSFHGVKALPEWLGNLSFLQNLSICDCSNMDSFPTAESLGYLTRLNELELGPFSEELEEFPLFTSIQNLRSSLEQLTLFGWEKLTSLPLQLQHLTELKTLRICGFHGVKALPEWLGNLSSLETLSIENCKNLEQVPSKEAMQRLSKLQRIYVDDCPGLEENTNELWASKRIYLEDWDDFLFRRLNRSVNLFLGKLNIDHDDS